MPHRGFSLIELLVALAVLGVLALITVAASRQGMEQAESAACQGNLRQWGVALHLYANEHNGALPRRGEGVQPVFIVDRPEDWINALPPYMGMLSYAELDAEGRAPKPGEHSIFVCPAAEPSGHAHFISYGMNMYLSPWIRPRPHLMAELPEPSALVFLADGPCGWTSTLPSSQDYSVQARHGGRANLVFVDGHVASYDGATLGCGIGNETKPGLRWETGTAGINQAHMP